MSGEHVSRPEFDLYMKIHSEAATQTATAITQLTEYTIHNDHKHEEVNRRLTDQGKTLVKIKEAVKANSKVTQIAKPIKWALAIIITGILMTYGANLANNYFDSQRISHDNP